MNNSILHKNEINEKDNSQDKELQKQIKIYESIQALKKSREFRTLIELVFEEELKSTEKRILRNVKLLKDDYDGRIKNQIIFDEGASSILRKISDLSDLENRAKVVIEKLK